MNTSDFRWSSLDDRIELATRLRLRETHKQIQSPMSWGSPPHILIAWLISVKRESFHGWTQHALEPTLCKLTIMMIKHVAVI